MSVAEQVMAALIDLPDEQQTVVLDFVEFLQQKKRSSMMGIPQQVPKSNLEVMRETLRQVVGLLKIVQQICLRIQFISKDFANEAGRRRCDSDCV